MKKRYDIIGDIHSCSGELFALLDKLGYEDRGGLRVHPDGRIPAFLGDFCDRGPNFLATYLFYRDMINKELAVAIMGNHDNKLMRMCNGNKVKRNHGLDKTEQAIIKAQADGLLTLEEIRDFVKKLPYYLVLDKGKLILSHAAWKDSLRLKSPTSGKVRSYCLYGPVAGFHDDGMPDRIDWAKDYKSNGETVVTGHQVNIEPRIINGVYQIDTGCVFGGKLTALRYPEIEIVQVDAFQKWDNSKFSDDILDEVK